MWVKCKQVTVSFKKDPHSITGYTHKVFLRNAVQMSFLARTKNELSQKFCLFWGGGKKYWFLASELLLIRITPLDGRTYCIKKKKTQKTNPPLNTFEIQQQGMRGIQWIEVVFLQQWLRVKHMHEESCLWLLVQSPFTGLAKDKLKANSQFCLKNIEWLAAVRTLLLLVTLSDWFTAQCWLEDWAY